MSKSIMNIQVILIFLLVSLLSACTAVSEEVEKDNTAEIKPPLAVIYGFDVKTESLWFLVKSNGCTKEDNFTIKSKVIENNTTEVSLYQIKRDLCRGMPKLISITMPIIESNTVDSTYVVVNPITAKPKRITR
jgi:hypothetical protein